MTSTCSLVFAPDCSLYMQLGETIDREWSEHGNIVFVATRFGRIEDLTAATTPTPTQNDYLFQSGAGSGGLKPFSISAEELADMAVVVFALYNIDQRADASVQYTCVDSLCMSLCTVPYFWNDGFEVLPSHLQGMLTVD